MKALKASIFAALCVPAERLLRRHSAHADRIEGPRESDASSRTRATARNRLFITEQPGVIRVLQPGASVPTVFLDIRARSLPAASAASSDWPSIRITRSNGRFFVYYTRPGDGAIVIAAVSRVGQSQRRQHDGHRVAEDRASDQRESQRRHARVRTGRLSLHRRRRRRRRQRPAEQCAERQRAARQDPAASTSTTPTRTAASAYSSPSDNPYVGRAGRHEIFSIGWRNPWRFSFDRSTAPAMGGRRRARRARGSRHADRQGRQLRLAGVRRLALHRTTIRRCAIPPTTSVPVFDYTHTGRPLLDHRRLRVSRIRRTRCRRAPTSTATSARARSSRGMAQRRAVLLDCGDQHLVVRRRRARRALRARTSAAR